MKTVDSKREILSEIRRLVFSAFSAFLLWLRNRVWDIRKRLNKDAFEKSRDDFLCGAIPLANYTDVTEKAIDLENFCQCMCSKMVPGTHRTAERDCILQYEETNQFLSTHWYLDNKYQLHARFFLMTVPNLETGEPAFFVLVHSHKEIRPDYDPIGHLRGKELESGCKLFWDIFDNEGVENE